MKKLTRESLYSLEKYAERRKNFREDVINHKKNRQVKLGDNATLYFEDNKTIQYQIQEMLRIEKIFEASGIQEELDTYNPLIPDGKNWKATFMLEYPDIEQRKIMLSKLIGIEDKIWIQVTGCEKVYAIADEDLERDTEEKTSAVHFMRFEFSDEMISHAKEGSAIAIGVDHPEYSTCVDPLSVNTRNALVADFD